MIFRPFYYFDRGCATYLFGCGTLSRCAVVDPRADDVDSYVSFAESKNMRATHVIDTHVHADHRSGGPELARRLAAPYCLHESADFTGTFTSLKDGDGTRDTSGSVCGAGLSGKPMSTIGFERRWNPMLSRDKQSFIDALADAPPKPADMEQIAAFNRGDAEVTSQA